MSNEKFVSVDSLNPKTEEEKALLAKFLVALQENPASIIRVVKNTTGAQLNSSHLTQEIRKLDKNVHYFKFSIIKSP